MDSLNTLAWERIPSYTYGGLYSHVSCIGRFANQNLVFYFRYFSRKIAMCLNMVLVSFRLNVTGWLYFGTIGKVYCNSLVTLW